jgi:hypothetical protein
MRLVSLKDIALVFLLLIIALSIRYYHHNHLKAVVLDYTPLYSDTAEYYNSALNLYYFGTFSTSKPSYRIPAQPDASRSPGYSIFLLPFIHYYKSLEQVWVHVIDFQAILGALIAVISFIIARLNLKRFWAFIVGLLAALSPHLIANEVFLLSETLYTFILIVANLFMCISWLSGRKFLAFASGLMVGISMLIRPIGILIGVFFAIIFLFNKENGRIMLPRYWLKPVLVFYLGITISFIAFPLRNYITLGDFYPENNRGWESIVDGSYINFTHKNPVHYGNPYNDDPENSRMKKDKTYFFQIMKERFVSRPFAYLKWYLVGKTSSSWEWDIAPNGGWDVYTYKLYKHGFKDNIILLYIYNLMKYVHKPLVFICFLTFPYLLFFYYMKSKLPYIYIKLLPPLITLIYFNFIMVLMFPLPRYTIPLRPYCYILAINNIAVFINYFSQKFLLNTPKTT